MASANMGEVCGGICGQWPVASGHGGGAPGREAVNEKKVSMIIVQAWEMISSSMTE